MPPLPPPSLSLSLSCPLLSSPPLSSPLPSPPLLIAFHASMVSPVYVSVLWLLLLSPSASPMVM